MMKLPNMLLAAAVVSASVAYTAPAKADDQLAVLSVSTSQLMIKTVYVVNLKAHV